MFPFVQKKASSSRELERNGCACAAECSDFVSVTLLTISVSFNDSSAFLLKHSPEAEIK